MLLSLLARLKSCLYLVDAIISRPRKTTADFIASGSQSNLSLYWRYHFPLNLFIPIFIVLSPFSYLQNTALPNFLLKHILISFFIIHFFLFLAMIYDRVSENGNVNLRVSNKYNKTTYNLSFYLHIPVAGISFFFFFHPLMGYLMLGLAQFWAIFHSIEYIAKLQQISRARAYRYWFMSLIFILIPLVIFLFMFTFIVSIDEFSKLN